MSNATAKSALGVFCAPGVMLAAVLLSGVTFGTANAAEKRCTVKVEFKCEVIATKKSGSESTKDTSARMFPECDPLDPRCEDPMLASETLVPKIALIFGMNEGWYCSKNPNDQICRRI